MGFWIIFFVILHINEQFPDSAFLKETHQGGFQCFYISSRHFVDLTL